MASLGLVDSCANRGRRKQAKPQRKNVEEEDTPGNESKEEQLKKVNDEDDDVDDDDEDDDNADMIRLDGNMCQTQVNDNNNKRKTNSNTNGFNIMDNNVEIKISVRVGSNRHNNNNNEQSREREVDEVLDGKHKVNGINKKDKPNFGLDHLLFKKTKLNGDCLNNKQTPVIIVKTVNSDLNKNNITAPATDTGDCHEDVKIQEYMKRSDTAVIYPVEPVDNKQQVPLSPATMKALKEADINNPDYFVKCSQCQKSFQTFQSLKEHIEINHNKSSPLSSPKEAVSPVQNSYSPAPIPVPGGLYSCPQCNATFSSKEQLDKHEFLHSPNAQVSCKVCNKQFANVYRLQRHMISHDESAVLRKFKCPECEKAFKFKHHLKEHIRIHSGEKPFQCANCGKRFSHSGSYSSHMTSKKCLVMNLKVNRGRSGLGIDKTVGRSTNNGGNKRNITTNNNNINNLKGNLNITTNNLNITTNNSFPSLVPKYSDAAAAFLSAVAPRTAFPSAATGLHPFYMAVPPSMHLSNSSLHPYNLPALSHFLEQLTPHNMLISPKKEDERQEQEVKEEKTYEDDVKNEDKNDRSSPVNGGGDLEAVKRILDTVNATVTKQLLQANMNKFTSSPSGSSCPSIASPPIEEDIECKHCHKVFQNRIDHHQHERYLCEYQKIQKSEGLAAKLEEVMNVKRDDCSVSDEDEEKECDDEDVVNHEDGRITITTQEGDDGRKVRVRSLIADEQLAILKHHYMINPRPKRDELAKIAEKIRFPVRVVQVWFQNTRARDRREGKLVHVPYLPLFQNSVPLLHVEQPLDLSTKKSQTSSLSPSSVDTDDVINLSRKDSNGLSIRPLHSINDFRRTPSPLAYLNLHQEELKDRSRLAKLLSQPSGQRTDTNGVSLVPMERLIGLHHDSSRSPLPIMSYSMISENGRGQSVSPGSDKRSWREI